LIFVGIDDTDIIGTPGTNQLARLVVNRIGESARDSIICRHQLFFDPRVPYTSKNGSASIQLPNATVNDIDRLTETIREIMRGWYVIGSDPGLCLAANASEEVKEFSLRCKSDLVTQDEAKSVAARAGCHLEGLGGTQQGIIGALAAVGLVVGGNDGRIVQLYSWPYPDDRFSGPHEIDEIRACGIDEIRRLGTEEKVSIGAVDIGKHLRPNRRDGRIVLYVEPATGPDAAAPWRAVKIP
jgi:hypothetical protein